MEKWRSVRKSLNLYLGFGTLLGGAFAQYCWNFPGTIAFEAVLLCLALGFWITEMLIGVFTQVKKANPTAIALLFFGKLAWWASIFVGARHLPRGLDAAVALGIGVFLLALLIASIRHYGMPRISDGNPPSHP